MRITVEPYITLHPYMGWLGGAPQMLTSGWPSTVSAAAHRHSSNGRRLSKSIAEKTKSSGAAAKCFRFSQPCSMFPAKPGLTRPLGEFYKTMNAPGEIRDHLLVGRMQHWLGIARCPLIDARVPTWRARKNYWFLVRRYPALAAANGLTATRVF